MSPNDERSNAAPSPKNCVEGSSTKPNPPAAVPKKTNYIPSGEDEDERFRSRGDDVFCILHMHSAPQYRDEEEVLFRTTKLQDYKHYQGKMFMVNTLKNMRDGKKIEVTDDVIIEEIELLYGPLDQECEQFKNMFECYKESYLEQLAECEKLFKETSACEAVSAIENNVVRNHKSAFSMTDVHIMNSFDPRECFTNPFKPKADWLSLPRPKSSRGFGISYLNDSVAAAKSPDFKENMLKLDLLSVDPKYVLFPRHVKCDVDTLGTKVLMRINETIDKNVTGLTGLSLMRYSNESVKHLNVFRSGIWGSSALFASLSDILCYREYNGSGSNTAKEEKEADESTICSKSNKKTNMTTLGLYFPSALDPYIVSLRTVLLRLRHYILILIEDSEHGFVHIAELEDLLFKTFQIVFRPASWSFSSWRDFLNYAMVEYDSRYVELKELFLINADINGRNAMDVNWYLVKRCGKTSEAIEKLMSPSISLDPISAAIAADLNREMLQACFEREKLHFEPKPIPKEFRTVKDPFPSIANQIQPSMSFKCHILRIKSPVKIEVVLCQHLNKCIVYKQDLNDAELPNDSNPHPSQLVHGLPVLYKEEELLSSTRRRAKVISHDEGRRNLALVDIGVVVDTSPKNVILAPKGPLTSWPTQAIPCKLTFSSKFYKKKAEAGDWQQYHCDILQKFLDGCRVFVTFVNKLHDKFYDENVWETYMSVYNPETEEIIVDNLAESFEKVAAKPIYDNADISDLKEYHPVFEWFP